MRSILLTPLFLFLIGCSAAYLQPEIESKRIDAIGQADCTITVDTTLVRSSRRCTEVERIEMLFESVELNKTTLADLRKMGFGPPHSTMTTVPAPEIRSRLTMTTDGGMEMLDKAVRDCIMHPNAAYQCEMVIFTDAYQRSRGANNPLARITGINKVNVVSGWSWEVAFVLERSCPTSCTEAHEHEYVVRYKQHRHTEDPPTRKRERLPILDSTPIDLSYRN